MEPDDTQPLRKLSIELRVGDYPNNSTILDIDIPTTLSDGNLEILAARAGTAILALVNDATTKVLIRDRVIASVAATLRVGIKAAGDEGPELAGKALEELALRPDETVIHADEAPEGVAAPIG